MPKALKLLVDLDGCIYNAHFRTEYTRLIDGTLSLLNTKKSEFKSSETPDNPNALNSSHCHTPKSLSETQKTIINELEQNYLRGLKHILYETNKGLIDTFATQAIDNSTPGTILTAGVGCVSNRLKDEMTDLYNTAKNHTPGMNTTMPLLREIVEERIESIKSERQSNAQIVVSMVENPLADMSMPINSSLPFDPAITPKTFSVPSVEKSSMLSCLHSPIRVGLETDMTTKTTENFWSFIQLTLPAITNAQLQANNTASMTSISDETKFAIHYALLMDESSTDKEDHIVDDMDPLLTNTIMIFEKIPTLLPAGIMIHRIHYDGEIRAESTITGTSEARLSKQEREACLRAGLLKIKEMKPEDVKGILNGVTLHDAFFLEGFCSAIPANSRFDKMKSEINGFVMPVLEMKKTSEAVIKENQKAFTLTAAPTAEDLAARLAAKRAARATAAAPTRPPVTFGDSKLMAQRAAKAAAEAVAQNSEPKKPEAPKPSN